MRIALLSWETLHSIPVGGVAVHVSELAAALERKGQDVHVFTRMGQGQREYEYIDGIHYHRCPFPLNANFATEIDDMCRSFTYHVFRTEDFIGPFDVIHAHDWLAAHAMIWIRQGRQRKSIFTMHSTEYGRCGNEFYNGQSEYIRTCERAGAHWSDKTITVSHSLKKEVMWMYEVPDWKISVIFNGVNLHQFDGWIDPKMVRRRYGIGPMDPVILFVGRMVFQKGPDLLIEAIPSVLGSYPHAKFVFMGDGEMKPHVQWRAEQLGIAHATRFLGVKSGWELADIFKASDAICIPSRNEPFGIVVLEAWSAGKPVIATVNGGPRELIWHAVTGLTIYPNPESIAWGVKTLFSNFEWARWMGANGRVAVEKAYTWNSVADSVLSVYSSC